MTTTQQFNHLKWMDNLSTVIDVKYVMLDWKKRKIQNETYCMKPLK